MPTLWKRFKNHRGHTEARFEKQKQHENISAKAHEVNHDWLIVDATDKVLGRLAAEVALRLRGKHKPEYFPHVDTGDFIVIGNADKVRVTGLKK